MRHENLLLPNSTRIFTQRDFEQNINNLLRTLFASSSHHLLHYYRTSSTSINTTTTNVNFNATDTTEVQLA
jgi:hypothetical protein